MPKIPEMVDPVNPAETSLEFQPAALNGDGNGHVAPAASPPVVPPAEPAATPDAAPTPEPEPVPINKIASDLLPFAVDINTLIPDPDNARKHPERNMEAIKASLIRYGQQQLLVCREDNRHIIAGNGRWAAARRMGWTKIAARFVAFDKVEASGFGVADNRTAELAVWDDDAMQRIVQLQEEAGKGLEGYSDDEMWFYRDAYDWKPPVPKPEDEKSDSDKDANNSVEIKFDKQHAELLEDIIDLVRTLHQNYAMTEAECLLHVLREWSNKVGGTDSATSPASATSNDAAGNANNDAN